MHSHTMIHLFEIGKKLWEAWKHSSHASSHRSGLSSSRRPPLPLTFFWVDPEYVLDFLKQNRGTVLAEDMVKLLRSDDDFAGYAPDVSRLAARHAREHPGKLIFVKLGN
jgi:hypothetical protein